MRPCLQLVNNVIRNIEGAGFGVWGCYDCFYAHNTLISTGNRSHLVDIKFGEHSCDGEVESQCVLADRRHPERCRSQQNLFVDWIEAKRQWQQSS